MSEDDKNTEKKSEISINEKTIEILIARLIPTSQYFEVRFDNLEQKFDYKFEGLNYKFEGLNDKFKGLNDKFDQLSRSQENLKTDMNKRFEQVDKRFEQVDLKLDKILDRIDRRIDEGLRETRSQPFRLFTFAMTFSAFPWWACSGSCSTSFSLDIPLLKTTL
ncbi:MAG: hypothetical protein J7M20_10015 [Deltaproteobacteria bacterium]|nr:hypothetical protein [Deltaproteobacteria bacterium]